MGKLISRTQPGQGEVLGRYRLRGLLSQGGMGRLYIAEQEGIEGFSKTVAVKQILPHLADSPQFRRMFLNEARVAARLEHPNIVVTYELGEVDGVYFIAMEYLPGEDLSAALARSQASGPLPADIAAVIAHQALGGLQYAHELRDGQGRSAGLVHRDVNPSNIFVTYHGMVKLLDFGVVKGATTVTSPGTFKGKYGYCAPEQLEGGTIDPRTDVFCVGIVLWECLSGQRLFKGTNDAQVMDAVRSQPIVPVSFARPGLPPELEAITMRALSRDRTRRFQSAFEMSEALDRYLSRRPLRPTAKTIGKWLESIFGAERASLKRALGEGNDIENTLAQLGAMGGGAPGGGSRPGSQGAGLPPPRSTQSRAAPARPANSPTGEPWPTSTVSAPERTFVEVGADDEMKPESSETCRFNVPEELFEAAGRSPTSVAEPAPQPLPLPPAPPQPAPKSSGPTLKIVALVAAIGTVGLVIFALRDGDVPDSAATGAAQATGALELQSDPSGANVLLDGEPTGLITPTVLRNLRPGRTFELRLDKPGYQTAIEKIQMDGANKVSRSVKLIAAGGSLRLVDLPEGASVYLDEVLTDARAPVAVRLGARKLRVESGGEVVLERVVDVQPGEQTIRVRPPGRAR